MPLIFEFESRLLRDGSCASLYDLSEPETPRLLASERLEQGRVRFADAGIEHYALRLRDGDAMIFRSGRRRHAGEGHPYRFRLEPSRPPRVEIGLGRMREALPLCPVELPGVTLLSLGLEVESRLLVAAGAALLHAEGTPIRYHYSFRIVPERAAGEGRRVLRLAPLVARTTELNGEPFREAGARLYVRITRLLDRTLMPRLERMIYDAIGAAALPPETTISARAARISRARGLTVSPLVATPVGER